MMMEGVVGIRAAHYLGIESPFESWTGVDILWC